MLRLHASFRLTLLLITESAKVRRLKNEIAECKSEYTNLEVMAAKAELLHTRTLSNMQAKYVSHVSSLEDELRSVVAAGPLPTKWPMLNQEGLPLCQRWLPS